MSVTTLKTLPGELLRSRSRAYGVSVALVDSSAIGDAPLQVEYEGPEQGRYVVVCVEHLRGTRVSSRSMAESFMPDTGFFCSFCSSKAA